MMHQHNTNNTKRQYSKGLSIRLMTTTLIYSVLIAVFVSGIQIYIAYQQAIDNAKTVFSQIDSSYAPNLTSSLWEVNATRTELLFNQIAALPNVSYIKITNENHREWSTSSTTKIPFATRHFNLTYNIDDQTFTLGDLYVELSNHTILKQLMERAIGIAITSSITLFLGSLFVLFLFQHWVTRYLKAMADFAEKLDLSNLHTELFLSRAPNKSPDELDMVVNSINKMQTTLKQDLVIREEIEAELRLHKEQLENIVSLRTQALEIKSRELEQQSLALEAQNRELDAYAHSVAHDLKNPLTTLVGMSSILNSGVLQLNPEKMQNSIGVIHKTALKMSSIIDSLLLLASVRRADDISPQALNMRAIAEEAFSRLADMAKRHNASISFVGNWDNAMGYEQWVEEVWMNYLSNAIKYGGNPPQIEIGCAIIENNHVKYWVRDHGVGIAATRRAELFIQFSRLDPLASEGHGLGLSIVKRIVQRLHGEVGYDDAEGGGSCFWFSLPAATAQE